MNCKISKEQPEAMKGDITMSELDDSLFNHMNGSSSPGIDGFTVAYLRVFWTDMRYIVQDTLNVYTLMDYHKYCISVCILVIVFWTMYFISV